MSDGIDTRVIQVTNLAPSCSKDQLRMLFSFLGRIKDLQMFPPETVDVNAVSVRVAYLEFEDTTTAGVSLHLNGTVFVDRALVIVPVMDGKIPDENIALTLTPQAVAGMLPGQPSWPTNVVSQVTGTGGNQVITTIDPKLTSLGLPQYPALPATTDPGIIDEIRRTVYVSDLDSKVKPEALMDFFCEVGEVKYLRMAGEEAAFVEFSDQRTIAKALSMDGTIYQGRTISVQHSRSQIIKPMSQQLEKPGKYGEPTQREIEEALKSFDEGKMSAAGDSKEGGSPSRSKRSRSKSKGRSRSRSRAKRSRSRSKGRRRRSRSRSKRRSRSRHRSPRRSRSPRRRRSRSRLRRSRSRDKRRSRTRSPVRRRRSRSRSISKKRKSRTPPKSYSKRSRSRSRKRSLSRSRKRSRSRDRKPKDRKKSASLSPPRLERNGSIPPKEGSPIRRDSSPKPEGPEEERKDSASGEETLKKPITKKRSPSPAPLKPRRRSPSPRKRSRSKSPRRIKRRRRTRSPSPRRRSRSRSGSRHRSKRDRGKRSRSRDRKYDSKRKSTRDKDDKRRDPSSSKVKRDYDEEEKGYASGSDKDREASEDSAGGGPDSPPPPPLETVSHENKAGDIDHQTVDMDMSD